MFSIFYANFASRRSNFASKYVKTKHWLDNAASLLMVASLETFSNLRRVSRRHEKAAVSNS